MIAYILFCAKMVGTPSYTRGEAGARNVICQVIVDCLVLVLYFLFTRDNLIVATHAPAQGKEQY